MRYLLLLCVFTVIVSSSARRLVAQEPAPALVGHAEGAMMNEPAAEISSPAAPANFLTGLPQPPAVPRSLMTPVFTQSYGCDEPECPYLERDCRLDPDQLGRPGWLAEVELDISTIHVVDKIASVVNGNMVSVPMASLDVTVAPRIELGYRLPSGFGEFDISYRFMEAHGSGTVSGSSTAPDGPAALTSSFRLNSGDLDYANNEMSLWPTWNMKWRIGLRVADVVFASTADESPALAAGGTGVFERAIRDEFCGLGPHATLELQRGIGDWGLAIVGRVDGAIEFGTVRQRFSTVGTTPALSGQTSFSNFEQVPILDGFLGLAWQPPSYCQLHAICGYQAEYWWNVGRLSDPDLYNGRSAGEFGAQGLVLRLEYNY